MVASDEVLATALAPHRPRPTGFDFKEAALRDVFDEFLTALERFDSFLESGLVEPADLKPCFHYWINVLSHDLREPVRSALWKFMRTNHYRAVISLVQRLGGTIPDSLPSTSI